MVRRYVRSEETKGDALQLAVERLQSITKDKTNTFWQIPVAVVVWEEKEGREMRIHRPCCTAS